MQDSILTTVVKDIDGEVTTLEKYAGNVLLIVNVASKCGLTPQYEQLENIQKAWADRGFVVLGFPCNQFLEQEPGSDEEIKTYCTTTWGVTFPMFSKIEVNGEGRHPLYQKLIAAAPTAVAPEESGFYARMVSKGRAPLYPDDILWNFEKFLVGRDGKAKNSNEIFYAGIFADEGFTQLSTDVSANIVPLDLAGGSEATAQVNVALPESGSITLYVTEVDSNGKPVAGAASFKYDVTVDNAQVTLNDDNLSANVVITNTENSTKVTPTPGTPNTPNTTGGFSGKSAVRTGDSTPIGGFIALFAAAAVIAGAAVFFKRRRKDEK